MKKNFIIILLFTLLLILIFANNSIVNTTAINSFELWQKKIFPSLFISFILQDIFIKYNASFFINYLLNNSISKIFLLSKPGQMAFVLSLISGSPSNAFVLSELVKNNKISNKEANHLLKFTHFANPLFLFTMLSLMFDYNSVMNIIFSLYISNLLLGFSIKSESFDFDYVYEVQNNSLANNITTAIKKSMDTLIMILGSVTFFMIISSIFIIYFDDMFFKVIISGLFEMTSGLNFLIYYDCSIKIKEIIAICIISFGGLSVHSQVYAILSGTKLSYLSFFTGRIFATLIAILIIILF
ncbi:MAG: hypothetical protein R3Y13_05175 [bacterium]